MLGNGRTVTGTEGAATTAPVASATPLACISRNSSRYASCSRELTEGSISARRSNSLTSRRQPSSLNRSCSQMAALSAGSSLAAISVPGCSDVTVAWARPLACVRVQKPSKSMGRAMTLRARSS